MNNQGLFGALLQYWGIDPKPRLHRKNTYFNDAVLDDKTVLRVGIVISTIIMVMVLVLSYGAMFI